MNHQIEMPEKVIEVRSCTLEPVWAGDVCPKSHMIAVYAVAACVAPGFGVWVDGKKLTDRAEVNFWNVFGYKRFGDGMWCGQVVQWVKRSNEREGMG